MPASTSWATGIRNLMGSVIEHLQTELPGVTLTSEHYLQAAGFPCVSVQDSGLPDLGDESYGDRKKTEGGVTTYGKTSQTQLEINIAAKLSTENRDPVNEVRVLHDKVKQVLTMAGLPGSGIPVINVKDFSVLGHTDTGAAAWVPTEMDTAWVPSFIKDDGNPTVWRYRIYVRVCWDNYRP